MTARGARRLLDPATNIQCPCGDVMRPRRGFRHGTTAEDVLTGRGRYDLDRQCPTCDLVLTVEISR